MPKRYQRKRIRGWRKADHCPDAVFVGRGTKWGNPFAVGGPRLHGSIAYTNEGSVSLFKDELKAGHLGFTIEDVKRELKGKDLMCWCREDEPWCHGDVLLEIANSTSGSIPQVQECGRPTETVCPKHKSRLCHCPGVV
ncbi:DUF4326 domain-containing protein [Candidatus Pacearchaeota archaeon]|nr:DUF4326 domain-containing protein [Candidatus Pacearchaeota archaeon]